MEPILRTTVDERAEAARIDSTYSGEGPFVPPLADALLKYKKAAADVDDLLKLLDGLAGPGRGPWDRCEVGSATCRWCGQYWLDDDKNPAPHNEDCTFMKARAVLASQKGGQP